MNADCSPATALSRRLAAALQRRDQRRSAGRAQPDEHHVQRAVREAVAGLVDADARVAEVGGEQEAVGGGQRQRQDQRQRDRQAVGEDSGWRSGC